MFVVVVFYCVQLLSEEVRASQLTLPPFWGRVECEKVAFLAAKKGPGDDDDHNDDDDGDDGDDDGDDGDDDVTRGAG